MRLLDERTVSEVVKVQVHLEATPKEWNEVIDYIDHAFPFDSNMPQSVRALLGILRQHSGIKTARER